MGNRSHKSPRNRTSRLKKLSIKTKLTYAAMSLYAFTIAGTLCWFLMKIVETILNLKGV